VGLVYALTRVLYRVNWSARGHEAAVFLRAMLGSSEAQAERAAMAALRGTLGAAERIEGLIAGIAGAAAGALLAVRRRARAVLAWLSQPRLPRPRVSTGRAPSPRHASPRQAWPRPASARTHSPEPPGFAADGFDSWFATVDEVEAATRDASKPAESRAEGPAPAPLATSQSPPSETSSAAVEWQKQVRAYSDNLDLDWEERVLKANRMRRELLKWDDDGEDEGGGQTGTA